MTQASLHEQSLVRSIVVKVVTLVALGVFLSSAAAPSASAIDNTWTLNGNGDWNTAGNWINGVPNTAAENAIIDDGDSAVTVSMNVNTTIGNLTIGTDDTLSFAESFDLTIAGSSVLNDGVISLNALGVVNVNTDLNFTAPVATLSGAGTLLLGGALQNRVTNSSVTNELINSATHTIAGGGQLGFNGMKLTNLGTIDANIAAATMFVDPSSSNASNSGTMRASNGGILRLQGGVFTNTGGFIRALNGSTVELVGGSGASGTHIIGGTLASEGTGVIRTIGGDGGVVLENVTLGIGSQFEFGANLDANIVGTITNNGAVLQQSTSGTGRINIVGNTALSGTGVWTMNNHANNTIFSITNGDTLTNDTQHTIQGSGDVGGFRALLINKGTIIANQSTPLQISSPNSSTVSNLGTLRATNGATLSINLGVVSSINNQGTIEALNGSSVTYQPSAATVNNMAGVLTGGTWRAVATGGGATVSIRGNNITQIAAGTTVELSGAGSVLQVVATPLESTLTMNNGTLKILGNRNYTAVPAAALVNNGNLELGGGTWNSTVLTNGASGQIYGFGNITPRPTNSGTIRAVGGTLAFANGIEGNGNAPSDNDVVQIDAGAALDVSGGTIESLAVNLVHNGAGLNLGDNDIWIYGDYNNANFGVGNSFNPRANVTGNGGINVSSFSQALFDSESTTFLPAGEPPNTRRLDFGNIHVGTSKGLGYRVGGIGRGGVRRIRGAVQTNVNGGNVTDSRLSGAGAAPGNFVTQDFVLTDVLPVTFTATTAGALSGQQVHIINNFDNMNESILQFTGAAYRLANPTAHTPEPVNFGIVHVGDVLTQALSIANNVPNDGFSERLDASIGTPTGNATTNSGTFSDLLPGSTNNSSLVVGINTSTAGAKTGTATISFVSDGTGSSGLGNTNLTAQTVNIQAQVNNFAIADVIKLSGNGSFTMTGPDEFTLNLGSIVEGQSALSATLGMMNDAAAPSDSLAGDFTISAPGFNLMGFAPFTGVAAGATQGGFVIALNDSVVGDFTGEITLQPQSTNPRPFSMNLDPITINIIGEVRLGGDYNLDGAVNAADYTVWRNTLGQTVAAGTGADGSGPGGVPDGMITAHDYAHWKARYGMSAPASGASSLDEPFSTSVPEPAGLLLLTIAVISFAQARIDRKPPGHSAVKL